MTTLVRFQGSTGPEIGLLSEGHVVPSGLGDSDWGPLLAAWALEGADVPAAGPPLPEDRMALLPPLTDCSRVFGVAQNYPAHAAEAGGDSPPTPIVFLKPASAFVGHNATASLPSSSAFYDYEAEVAVIIGRSARGVSAHDAVGVVAGYSIGNDGSARDLQPATLANRFQVDSTRALPWGPASSAPRRSPTVPLCVLRRSTTGKLSRTT